MVATNTNTGSTLSNGSLNKTSTGLSTNIIIKVGPTPVGAVQSLDVKENRPIKMVSEVGTDGHIDSVPNQSTDISGNCTRIRYDRMRMTEAFGRAYLHVKSQRYPFDIIIIDRWNGDDESALITTIKNVWFENVSYTYGVSDYILQETASWKAEDIYTTLANGPAATGGENSIPLAIQAPTSDIERDTDVGGRRGSLDAPGILRAALPF